MELTLQDRKNKVTYTVSFTFKCLIAFCGQLLSPTIPQNILQDNNSLPTFFVRFYKTGRRLSNALFTTIFKIE